MINVLNLQNKEQGKDIIDAKAALYQQFEASSIEAKKRAQQLNEQSYPLGPDGLPQKMPPRVDEETGLEWCEYHYDRIKHFLCIDHKQTCCRVCHEIFHNKPDCGTIDLYEVDDMHAFLTEFYKKNRIEQNGEMKNGEQQQNDN
ncbi:hypothetical protein IMG5_182800, partial [Ichthyophthirius multifiliis]